MLLRRVPCTNQLLCVRCLNYYDILGIPRTATKAEIKQAYLDKAKECHPDLNPDNVKAAVLFQELQEARDTLMDSQLRAQYNSQINQDSYYGSQQTHRPVRHKSNVRTYGYTGQYSTRKNTNFHDNHRVNQDNYQRPGSQREHTLRRDTPAADDDVFPGSSPAAARAVMSDSVIRGVYMLGAAFVGVTLYSIVRKVSGSDEDGANNVVFAGTPETNDSGSAKSYSSSVSEPRRYVYNAEQDATIRDIPKPRKSSIERPGKANQEIIRYVWSDEKQNLVPMSTLKSGHGSRSSNNISNNNTLDGDLKDKFDAKMQTNLGHVKVGEITTDFGPNPRVTLTEIRNLKKELSKKKSEYLGAKLEYAEKLEVYRAELKEKKQNDQAKNSTEDKEQSDSKPD